MADMLRIGAGVNPEQMHAECHGFNPRLLMFERKKKILLATDRFCLIL